MLHTIHMRPKDLIISSDPEYADVSESLHGADTRALEPIESPAMLALRCSIRNNGFMPDKPVTVAFINGWYVVLDGTRRTRASRVEAPDTSIPCCVVAGGNLVSASIHRNVARQSTPLERAHEAKRMLDSGMSLDSITEILLDSMGARMTPAQAKRLAHVAANLIPEAQECIRRYDAGETSARAIPYWTLVSLATLNPQAQRHALNRIVAKRMEGDVVDAKAGAAIAAGAAVAAKPSLKHLRQLGSDAALATEQPLLSLVLQWVSGDLPESSVPRLRQALQRYGDAGVWAKQTKLR